jgi:hypothetical protein
LQVQSLSGAGQAHRTAELCQPEVLPNLERGGLDVEVAMGAGAGVEQKADVDAKGIQSDQERTARNGVSRKSAAL